MSGDDERDRALARFDRSDRGLERSGTDAPAVDDQRVSDPAPRDGACQEARTTIDDLATSLGTESATVETASVSATLVGVPRVDVREFVYEHRLARSRETAGRRHLALLDVHNTGSTPLRWRSSRTTFIGDDDYTYGPSSLPLDPSRLGPGCHPRQVEIEPGRRARVVTLAEALPEDVEVVEVVQTLVPRGGSGQQRLAFSVP